eukprot:3356893-Heterocapsa_arctica.AAC.1
MLGKDFLLLVGLTGHFLRLLRLPDKLIPVDVDARTRRGAHAFARSCPSLNHFPASVDIFLRYELG